MTVPEPTRITVATAQPYDVLIGTALLGELPGLLGETVSRVAIIHPRNLLAAAEQILAQLEDAGYRAVRIEIPDAERAKDLAVAQLCWSELGNEGFTRSDAVIGIGGGATTDLAGFVAATWLRGVKVVHVPTTLLGMVDAAVGGKTGINTAEGKNLVGAFHEPAGVLCDLSLLSSLPLKELTSGLAEVIKCGFIADPQILRIVQAAPERVVEAADGGLRELVERSVRVKADVVAGDLTERTSSGSSVGREVLNYGHTCGHAIERVEGFRWRHGEAISVGMVYVAELSRLAGRLDDDTAGLHREILQSVGLPTDYPGGSWSRLHAAMKVDKKTRGDTLRFVVLDGLAQPAILEGPADDLLTAAFAAISG